MRLVGLRRPEGGTGVVVDGWVHDLGVHSQLADLAGWPWSQGPQSIIEHDQLDALTARWKPEWTTEHTALGRLEDIALNAPVNNPGQMLFVGMNYRDHALELGVALPERPHVFVKLLNALTGPYDDVTIPPTVEHLDHEVELAVVIGKNLRRAGRKEAADAIAGYTVVNDFSARDWQFATDSQLTLAKGFESFCPMGPCLVTPDELPHPESASIGCTVNGQIMQESRISELVFGVSECISFLSQIVRLQPGDVISTGTPAGVQKGRSSPRWLEPGDIVESWVEGVGRIRNRVTLEPTS